MAVSTGVSCLLSASLSLLLMAGMQFFKSYLISSPLFTVFSGFLGSIIFLLLLTTISNFEMITFGKHFQSKYTEVIISLMITLFTVGLVHRVSITTCILFSISTLYFVNRISTKVYQTSLSAQSHSVSKGASSKKRKN